MKHTNQSGLSIIGIIISAAIVGILLLVSFKMQGKKNVELLKSIDSTEVAIDPQKASTPQGFVDAVENHVNKVNDDHNRKLECQVEGNCDAAAGTESK